MAVTFPVPFDRVQTRAICYTPQQVSENVLDWIVRSPVITGGASVQEIATALNTTWHAAYKAMMPSVARFRGVSAQDLSSPISNIYFNNAHDGVGTQGVSLAPTQTSFLLRKHTLSGGRSNRGRIYVGFPSLDWVFADGGTTPAALVALLALAAVLGPSQTIVGAGGTTNLDLVIWHRSGPINYTLVDSIRTTTAFATQRRRGQFGRINVPPF